MTAISIFNHVLGPVMRGPSSSHTAGAYHLGRMAVSLLGERPVRVRCRLDPLGSYARTFTEQGADRALATALLGWDLTDARFCEALTALREAGIVLDVSVESLVEPAHPNAVDLDLTGASGTTVSLRAHSIGGGAVEIVRLGHWPLRLDGTAHEVLLEAAPERVASLRSRLEAGGGLKTPLEVVTVEARALVHARRSEALSEALRRDLAAGIGDGRLWTCAPVFRVARGEPPAGSAADLMALAAEQGRSLGAVGLAYESALLGCDEESLRRDMDRRLEIMITAVHAGLEATEPLQLLEPTAAAIWAAEAAGDLAIGGLHTRAATRALAVMHVNASMGVICAAPTGGAAGVLPGVLVSLMEDRALTREAILRGLFAAGAVGMVLARRATFAAEVAGCQVEIGAAGAMAAAAVVEIAGGDAAAACDAAAVALQNTMGSVCDLVQGIVEIPCHTRNAAAASAAFVCADLVLGGYRNPVPLDPTIDAVYAVGRMLPRELRCTAAGGLAATPAARALRPRRPRGGDPDHA